MSKRMRTALLLLIILEIIGYCASFMWNMSDKPHLSVPGGILWHQVKYFTIWANLLVLLSAFLMWWRQRCVSDSFFAALTLWMLIVMVVWHVLLGNDETPVGFNYVSNLLLHTINPILITLIWLFMASKKALKWKDAVLWLLFPLLYLTYAITRGLLSDVYPYFFLNLKELGLMGLINWIMRFLVAFYISGVLIVFIGKAQNRFINR